MARTSKSKTSTATEIKRYTVGQVWAAAARAYFVNRGYVSASTIGNRPKNSMLAREYLETGLSFSEKEIELGDKARAVISSSISFKILTKSLTSEFDQSVAKALNKNEFTEFDKLEIGVIAYQIEAYHQMLKIQERKEDLVDEYLGKVGDAITATITVFKCAWSDNYGTYFVSGKTDTNRLVFFSQKNPLTVNEQYSIKGKIKNLRIDSMYKVSVTHMNYVKIV